MKRSQELQIRGLRAAALGLALAAVVSVVVIAPQTAQAQTYTVLYNFGMAPQDGLNPAAGLIMDAQGSLYGTAPAGGLGYGTVYQLKPYGSTYVYRQLYSFQGGDDGDGPYARVTIGPNGSLYGTTAKGGGKYSPYNNGTVYNLQPSPVLCRSIQCPWKETILLRFNLADGAQPYGPVTFDPAGDLYGSAYTGGAGGYGVIYELTPSGGSWNYNLVHSFSLREGSRYPEGALTLDSAGNVYGTTRLSGNEGNVYQVARSGQSWTLHVLYSFTGGADGGEPQTGVIFDQAGNLFGGTGWDSFTSQPGTIYELTPSGGGWNYSLLYSFPTGWEQGAGFVSELTMDKDGNLYGTRSYQGLIEAQTCRWGCGSVFKLTPSSNGWTYTDVYLFTGKEDGGIPYSGVLIDSQGNLYGTAAIGGAGSGCGYGCGVVWKITP